MSNNTKELATKLNKAGAAIVPAAFENNIKRWYGVNRKKIVALVGGKEDQAALYMAATFAMINKIPKLLECKPETLYQCILYSMGMGLLPGFMGECYFVPYGDEAIFIPGYQGLVKLAYNSGFVTRITGHVVWEADEFDYNPATEEIYHKPFMGPEKDRGKRIAAYVCIKNRFGEIQPTVKSAEFIESIKKRSRGAQSKYSPWNSEYPSDVDAMWLKTVFKQAVKWIPKSSTPQGAALGKAIEIDNRADTGDVQTREILPEDVLEVKKQLELDISKEKENDNN